MKRIEDLQNEENLKEKEKELLKDIAENYPLTFIEKVRIQGKADKLDKVFWLTAPKGRILLGNKKFCEWLKTSRDKTEKRMEADVFPPGLHKVISELDGTISESNERVEYIPDNSGIRFILVRIPLKSLGVDHDLKATMVREAGDIDKNIASEILENLISELHLPAIVIDSNGNLLHYSKKFREVFLAPGEGMSSSWENAGKILIKKILDFFNESSSKKNLEFTDTIDYLRKDFNIQVSRLNFSIGSGTGYLVSFSELTNNSNLILKGNMYEVLMHSGPQAIFIYDVENLKFLEVNDAALRLYGYNREEFLQMDLTDLYAPEDIQTLIESSGEKTVQGKFTGPLRHQRKDGSSLLVELSKSTIDYEGKRAHINIVRDVTESVEHEKQFRLYKDVFDKSSDIIFITDPEGYIKSANRSFTEYTGIGTGDVGSRNIKSLVNGSEKDTLDEKIFKTAPSSRATFEASLKDKNGEFGSAVFSVSPVRDHKDNIEAFSFLVKLSEADSDKVTETHSETGKQIDASFLSHLFHEILTPINVIIGFGQELIESVSEPTREQKESADIINENQKLLLQIMDSAAEYSTLANTEVVLKTEKVAFVDLLDKLEESTERVARNNEITLKYGKISSSLEFTTDKSRFVSALTLFMSFAMQISKNEKIFISAQQYDESHFVVSLKDDMPAISEDLFAKLKEVFSADENIIRQKYGFSRFSVRLIRRYLDLFQAKTGGIKKGGKPVEYGIIFPIDIKPKKTEQEPEHEEDEAPSFEPVEEGLLERKSEPVIHEPVMSEEKTRREEEPADVTTEKEPEQKKPKKSEIDLKSITCLYLEDQVDSQILFKVQMKDLKNIEFANSVEKALPLIEDNNFDFIVMDINLQGEYNGLDALRIIKKLPGYENTPVVAVTAYVLPGDKEKFIQAGFSDFISKPLLREDLISTLKKIL